MVPQKAAPVKNGATAPVTPAGGWSETVNLAGSEASSTGGSKECPVNSAGKVKCKCIAVKPRVANDGSGKTTYNFRLQILEPAHVAGKIFGKVNADIKNEKAKNFWNTTLQSFGVQGGALQKGPIKINEAMFLGKICYMYLNPEKNSKGYDTREFLTPTDAEAQEYVQDTGPTTETVTETIDADPFAE